MRDYPFVILVGHPGSQSIVKVSKYLTGEYMPMFSFIYLNHKGGVNNWAEYVSGFLKYLTDEYVIFALDDYFIANPIDIVSYAEAERKMIGDVMCVKLCQSTPEEHDEYPCTTQYCLWNRDFLISILERTHSPWQFEILGSQLFNQSGKKSIHHPCLEYDVHSALSSRWEGVNLKGLEEEDLTYLTENKLL